MNDRQRVPTAAPWAELVGYSRAVRTGGIVHVSGTAAVDVHGAIAHVGDAYAQARRCIEIIDAALQAVGAVLDDVVRTRIYVRNASDWEAVGRAHGEAFGQVQPATTMVVTGFIDPAMLVEIEAEAVITGIHNIREDS